jgi:hypothetical protein
MAKLVASLRRRSEQGMTTAEYATGTVAACGFAGVLYKLVQSDTVQNWISNVVSKAFGLFG